MKIEGRIVTGVSRQQFKGSEIKHRSGVYEPVKWPKRRLIVTTMLGNIYVAETGIVNRASDDWFSDQYTFVEVEEPVHITFQN